MNCPDNCPQLVKGANAEGAYYQCTNGSKVIKYRNVNGFRVPVRGALQLAKDKQGYPIKICKDFE